MIEWLEAFLREAEPDITQRVMARRLTLKRRWAGDVRRAAHVRKEAVHLGGDVGPGGPGAREIGHSQYSRPGSGRAKHTADQAATANLFHQKSLPTLVFVSAKMRSMISRSEEHTSELQSLMRISYAVFCLKKTKHNIKKKKNENCTHRHN